MEEILPYLFMTDRQTDPIQTTNQQTDINHEITLIKRAYFLMNSLGNALIDVKIRARLSIVTSTLAITEGLFVRGAPESLVHCISLAISIYVYIFLFLCESVTL